VLLLPLPCRPSRSLSFPPPAVLQVASEAVSNMRTVAAFSAEDKVLGLFNSHLAGPLQRAFKRGQIAGIGFGSGQFALFASFGLALWYAGQLVSQGHGEFGQVLKVFMVSPAAPPPPILAPARPRPC
jgi:ABC-type bacteriocin/lantibiotic exporter with double-glycine peptidase domain